MERFRSFEEFWPFYVGEHSLKLTRILHFIGTLFALALIGMSARFGTTLLFAVPIAGYGFAWGSHVFVEKNRPATFTYPLWSLIADLKMFVWMAGGRMDREVDRCRRERSGLQSQIRQVRRPGAKG